MLSYCCWLSSVSGGFLFLFEEKRRTFFDGDAEAMDASLDTEADESVVTGAGNSVMGNLDVSLMPKWRERWNANKFVRMRNDRWLEYNNN